MHSELHTYRKHILQAVGLLVLGFFGFSVADLCSKILQDHYKIYQILMISGGIGASVSTLWILSRYGWRAFFPKKFWLHIARGLVISGTAFCMVSALRTLPMADFYGVVFLSPFLTLILSVLFLKEHVGWRRWLAVAVAFCGVMVLAGPQFNNLGEGFAYAFVGACCSATSVILLRKIGHGAPMPLYSFFPSFFIFSVNGTAMLATQTALPLRWEDALEFSFHGPAALLGVICTSLGYARSPEASIVAPFMYTQIFWGILFGWLVFHNDIAPSTALGLSMIIGAGCYSIWRDYQRAHDKHKIIPDIT